MKFSASFIAIFLHALITLVLSILIPALEPFSPENTAPLLVVTVVIAGNVFIALKSGIPKKTQDISEYLDVTVFLSIWTGLNQLAFKTRYPAVSIRNYPEITRFFPALFVLGLGLIIWLVSSRQLKFAHKAWLVTFMVTSLPYTHPLDQHTLGMCFPLMLLLYAVHRDTKNISAFLQNTFFRALFIATAALFIFQLLFSLKHDFDHAVPDILFFATLIFVFPLILGAIHNQEKIMLSTVKKAITGHVALIMCLAIIWTLWTASAWGALSILKYRLWVSMIHPNALAAYLAASFLVLEPWKRRSEKHLTTLIISVGSLVMLLMTQSRGMVFALLLSVLIVNFRRIRLVKKLESEQRKLFISAIAACVFLAFIIYGRVHYRLLNVQMIQDRIAMWRAGWNGIKTHLGSGFSFGSKQFLAQYVTDPFCSNNELLRLWMDWDRLGRHFHNLIIEVLWLFGLPGLLVFLSMLYGCFFRNKLNRKYSGLVTAALALLLFGFFDCPIYYSAIMFLGVSLFSLLAGVSIELEDTDRSLSVSHRTIAALPAIMAVGVLLFVVIPAFHQRCLFSWGFYQTSHDIEKSKDYLKAAAFYKPPSGKAAEKLVGLLLDQGKCIDAVSIADTYISKTKTPTIRLTRLEAWLERNQSLRLERLQKAWQSDPSGLMGDNLALEVFLMQIQSESFDFKSDATVTLLADRNFYMLLRDHGQENPEGVRIDSKAVMDILLARGLYLSSCNVHYSPVVVPLEDMLTSIEAGLSRCNENVLRCNKMRQAYFLSMLKAHDFIRATRVANSWDFDLSETQLIADVQTFRDGSGAYSIIQARKALSSGDYPRAEQHLLSASIVEKSNPEWFYMMSIVLGQKGDWRASLENISSALLAGPHDVRFLMEKGVALYHLGHHDRALQVFREILNISPWSVKAQSYAGITLYELEQFEEAVTHFEIARDLTPEDPQAYFNLYMALTASPDRVDDAEKLREIMYQKFDDTLIPKDLKEILFAGDARER